MLDLYSALSMGHKEPPPFTQELGGGILGAKMEQEGGGEWLSAREHWGTRQDIAQVIKSL